MGGTKNKEEKKKKAHVYAYAIAYLMIAKADCNTPQLHHICCRSGAAGGANKGPAVVDKRNQTLECPHCDRSFQQVQRYREHIAKKHPPEEQQEDESGASGASNAVAPQAQVAFALWLIIAGRLHVICFST